MSSAMRTEIAGMIAPMAGGLIAAMGSDVGTGMTAGTTMELPRQTRPGREQEDQQHAKRRLTEQRPESAAANVANACGRFCQDSPLGQQ